MTRFGTRGAGIAGPLVSVIIPCYNQGRFLPEAIDSVLGQTYPCVEVIVVDDGATDDTAAAAGSYEARIRCVKKSNAGLSAARNTGILEAHGDFILCLDSDDYLRPDALERYMEAARDAPAAAAFHGSFEFVDIDGRVLKQRPAKPLGPDPFHTLLSGNRYFSPNAVLIRRPAFANAGIFDVSLRSCEDWDMWIRLAASGYGFQAVPDAVSAYRHYPGSMSKNAERMWLTGLEVVRKHQAWHRNCGECRRSIAKARWHLRDHSLDTLIDELDRCHTRGEAVAATWKIVRMAVRTPPILRLLPKQLKWYLLRRTASTRQRLGLKRPEA